MKHEELQAACGTPDDFAAACVPDSVGGVVGKGKMEAWRKQIAAMVRVRDTAVRGSTANDIVTAIVQAGVKYQENLNRCAECDAALAVDGKTVVHEADCTADGPPEEVVCKDCRALTGQLHRPTCITRTETR